jgi:hypothetical protein
MAETPEINDATVESTSPGTADPLRKYPLVKLADESGDESIQRSSLPNICSGRKNRQTTWI